MFDCEALALNQKQKGRSKPKVITFMLNGQPERTFQVEITNRKTINKQKILRGIEKNWGISFLAQGHQQIGLSSSRSHHKQIEDRNTLQQKPNQNQYQYHNFTLKNLRVFSSDAVQYFDEDLQYVKNGDRLYISNGDDFDNNSNFGQYKIIRKLGEGGFGSVQLARNIVTKQFAAIKIVKSGKKSNSFDIDMIFKEAENLKALNHPNIIKILNCYALSDMRVVIVMQYLQGGQLLGLLKKSKNGKFEQKQAKVYFKQIISGVGYCHRKGIIHRDLKLQNILIKTDIHKDTPSVITLKIADFGISGVADRWNPQVDWGTLRYMAPQVLGGRTKTNSSAVDVWACGVILYKMVTGKYPFDGNSSSEIFDAIVGKQVEFPSNVLLTIKCKKILREMLEKDPLKRITVADIEDHPWLNSNSAVITLPEEGWSLKTTGSCQTILNLNIPDEVYNGVDMNEYDIIDLKKMTKSQLTKIRTKRSFHKNGVILDQKNCRNIYSRKKSVHPMNEQIHMGTVKLPRKMDNLKQEIMEQLKNYKELREKTVGGRDKELGMKKQKEMKEMKGNTKMRYNYTSEVNDEQKERQLFPVINNKRQNKIMSNINFRKQVQSSFAGKI